MSSARAGNLLTILSQVPDPRGRKGRRHCLSAMLAAVVCGLLSGVRGYESLVEWLHDLPVEFWHFLGFTRTPPLKDAFRDLLIKLDPDLLEQVLARWIAEDLKLDIDRDSLQGISVDGKTLCGTLRPFARAVHLLSAVDHQTGCVLSQCRVDEKTNEHKAVLGLLRSLLLEGRVVVGDALFCQREVCEEVTQNGGDYLFAVKENQPGMLREIQQELAASEAAFSPYAQRERQAEQQTASTFNKGHGRIERRTLVSTTSLNEHLNWPGVKQVCRLTRERTIGEKTTTEAACFVTSLSREQADAARLLRLIRDHWGAIENGLHYVRDETMGEDRLTIFRGQAPQNLAALRNMALNWLRRQGVQQIAATLRSFNRKPLRLFTKLGYVK